MARSLQRIADLCDAVNEGAGRLGAWLILAAAILMAAVAILRYGFETGWVALQESVVWLHGTAIMLGMGYALRYDEHVRIDILYRRFGPRYRALVNLIGSVVLLLPTLGVLAWYFVPYVMRSWAQRESSVNPGGLEYLYVFKTILLVYLALLGLQALAFMGRELCRLIRHRGETGL